MNTEKEPQAQAEPVVWTFGPNLFKDWCGRWFGPDSDDAYLAKAANDLPFMANPLREAIAKKDAALEACVEAHTKLRAAFFAFHATQKSGDVIEMGKALADISDAEAELEVAITKAKEARK